MQQNHTSPSKRSNHDSAARAPALRAPAHPGPAPPGRQWQTQSLRPCARGTRPGCTEEIGGRGWGAGRRLGSAVSECAAMRLRHSSRLQEWRHSRDERTAASWHRPLDCCTTCAGTPGACARCRAPTHLSRPCLKARRWRRMAGVWGKEPMVVVGMGGGPRGGGGARGPGPPAGAGGTMGVGAGRARRQNGVHFSDRGGTAGTGVFR